MIEDLYNAPKVDYSFTQVIRKNENPTTGPTQWRIVESTIVFNTGKKMFCIKEVDGKIYYRKYYYGGKWKRISRRWFNKLTSNK